MTAKGAKIALKLAANVGQITSVAFDPHSIVLACGTKDGYVCLWSMQVIVWKYCFNQHS